MLHEILRENLLKVVDKAYRSACFIYPDIPEKKKINASKYIGNNCSIDDIVAIVDATIFSNTKAGLLFSKTRFYAYFAGTKCEISYADIESIENEKITIALASVSKENFVDELAKSEINFVTVTKNQTP